MKTNFDICPNCGEKLIKSSTGYTCPACGREYSLSKLNEQVNPSLKKAKENVAAAGIINAMKLAKFEDAEKLAFDFLKQYPDDLSGKFYLLCSRYKVMNFKDDIQLFDDSFYRNNDIRKDSLFIELSKSPLKDMVNKLAYQIDKYISNADSFKRSFNIFLLTDDEEFKNNCNQVIGRDYIFSYNLNSPFDALCLAHSKNSHYLVINITNKNSKTYASSIIKRFNYINNSAKIILVKSNIFKDNKAIMHDLIDKQALLNEANDASDVDRIITGAFKSKSIIKYESNRAFNTLKESSDKFKEIVTSRFDNTSYIDNLKELVELKESIEDKYSYLINQGLSITDITNNGVNEYGTDSKKRNSYFDKFVSKCYSLLLNRMTKLEEQIVTTSKDKLFDFSSNYISSLVSKQEENYKLMEGLLKRGDSLKESNLTYKSLDEFSSFASKTSIKSSNAKKSMDIVKSAMDKFLSALSDLETSLYKSSYKADNAYENLKQTINYYAEKYDASIKKNEYYSMAKIEKKYKDAIKQHDQLIKINEIKVLDDLLSSQFNQAEMCGSLSKIKKEKVNELIKKIDEYSKDYHLSMTNTVGNRSFSLNFYNSDYINSKYRSIEKMIDMNEIQKKDEILSQDMQRASSNVGLINKRLTTLCEEQCTLIKKFLNKYDVKYLASEYQVNSKTYYLKYFNIDYIHSDLNRLLKAKKQCEILERLERQGKILDDLISSVYNSDFVSEAHFKNVANSYMDLLRDYYRNYDNLYSSTRCLGKYYEIKYYNQGFLEEKVQSCLSKLQRKRSMYCR